MKVWTVLTEDLNDSGVTVTVYESKASLTRALIKAAIDLNDGLTDAPFSIPTTLEEAIEVMANDDVHWTVEEKDVL